ncbi:MAG TPA: ABC transporter permease [Phycisphaerae bacterium]|nr:ABC transporter permease [Phycisphaerae bacterium]
MRRALIVALREYVETVKTRAFLFGVILMPAVIVGIMILSLRISEVTRSEAMPPRLVVVFDRHGAVLPHLERSFEEFNAANPNQPLVLVRPGAQEESFDAALSCVRDGEVEALLEVSADAVSGEGGVRLARRGAQLDLSRQLNRMAQDAIVRVRFEQESPPLDRDYVLGLEHWVRFELVDVATGAADGDEAARALTPFIFVFVLYMGMMGISYGLLTSVIEEKNSRIVEVLLSAVSPLQLMAGKIIGMVLVGVTMLAVWVVVGYCGAQMRGMTYLIEARTLFLAVLYFIPGFLLMSSLLAGVGAACNTLKEAQSMSSPLSLINIVPIMLSFQISQYPNSALSVALSYVPPITPFVMILRICGDQRLPLWELLLTQLLLWASVLAAMWAASKIFRIGILMYGKPPSLIELARWVRST